MLHEQEKQKGNANRATLAVARKLVAYLVAVDRRQKEFLTVERENRTAAEQSGRNTRRISSARSLPGLAVKPTGRRSASSGCSR